jgi:tetratricopeptide (TPR) repeat protein
MRWFLALFFFLATAAVCAPEGVAGDSIVVASFSNRTADTNLDWIGESLSEAVREALATAGLQAVRRPDRQQALRKLALPASGQITIASAVRLGESLNANLLIAGQFELLPDPASAESRGSLRVAARVIDLSRVAQKAEFSGTGALEDLAMIQAQIAWQVLNAIHPGGQLSREEFTRRHPAVKITALENYIRGLMAATMEQQHRFFTQAYRLDPTLWQPCYYLGRMHWEQENFREAAGWLEKIPRDSASYQEAIFLLGISKFQIGEFEDALKAFQLLASEKPDPEILNNLGAAQWKLNQPDALSNLRRALDAVPTDPDYHFNVGYALWKKGDYEEAADRFRAVLDREPDDQDAILLLGRCLKRSGPRTGDLRSENLERIKDSLEERGAPPAAQQR